MTTISSNKTSGIDLTSASYTNPIVVNGGVTIAGAAGGALETGAVYAGQAAGAWSIQNSGTINGGSNGGIVLLDGGSVTNAHAASITGNFAVYINDGGPVVNSGTIAGSNAGVDLGAGGGSVTNAAGGSISGQAGVEIYSAGAITNAASASITGSFWGILQNSGGAAGVVNSGSIRATGGTAVYLLDGIVTNAASGSIVGGEGVYLKSGGTVTNAGTITGSGGTAVYLSGYGNNRLVVDPGAVFNGIAKGGTYATNALEFASGSTTGTLTGLGTSFTNFGTVTVDSGASWKLTGTNTITSGSTLTNAGSIAGGITVASGGGLTNASGGTITNGGSAAVYGVGGLATVVNSGTIAGTGTGGIGVALKAGGSVTNAASGSVTGVYISSGGDSSVTNAAAASMGGVEIVNVAEGVVLNSGTMGAVDLVDVSAARVNNAASASMGVVNIQLDGSGYVYNAGTMGGVQFSQNAAYNRLAVRPGAVFTSNVSADPHNPSQNTLVLVSGSSAGTLSELGTKFTNFGNVDVDSGASWKLTGTNTIASGTSFTDQGTLTDAGTLANAASIAGAITVASGGVLTNAGTITNGGSAAIYGVGGPGTVVNSGSIAGTGTAGIGILLSAGGTVTNAGTITGSGGTAVSFVGTTSNRLVVDPGAVFSGKVSGSTSASNTLELAAGGSTGTLTGLGTSFVNFGTETIDSGASWELTGSNSITAGTTFTNSGTLINAGALVLSGVTVAGGDLVNNGGIVLDPSTLTVTDLTGSGSVTVSSGSLFDVRSGNAGMVTVSNGGTLEIDAGAVAGNTVTVLSGGTLELTSGGALSSVLFTSGAFLEVASGAALSNYATSGGVTPEVASGGTVSGATISSGAVVDVLDGGTLTGSIANDGTLNYDITGSTTFSGTLSGAGTLVVSGGGHLDVVSAYTGAAQIDDTSTLEFSSTYVGAAAFSGASTGPGGTLKLDVPSTGPIMVVNPNDTVVAQPGGNNWINSTVNYTLPANIDALFLYSGTQGTGNSDAAGDALYALNAGAAQTLTGNSANDTFVVDNSSDVVAPKPGSHDVVFAAASYTLPTEVDALILEGSATQGVGNSDAAGDGLYAANPGQVATLTGNSANDTFVVYNSSDVVVPKAGSHDVVYSAVNYTLPTGVDVLLLEAAATQGVGNSDAAGDALYAANPSQVATLTGNSPNDTFVVYNSSDVVVPKAGSHEIVYSAVNYALPTGVDSLILEAGTQAIGNSDVAGDNLYAANAGIAQTLTGNSRNDTFAVYNAGDTVIGQAGSTDTVYAAANFTLPTNVDTLLLEGDASHGTGNNDAIDALYGNVGVASTLVAGSGADSLYVTGTAGTILTGGAGHDTFAFPNVMGHDEVTNFGIAKDTLQFNATLFSNFTAAMNAASQAGANTVFTIDANDTVTLDNVAKTSLTASNFHFT